MRKAFILMIALMITLSSTCLASPYKLVEDEYTVQAGDSLDAIAEAYMEKNTYGPRELREFKSSIVQLNNWLMGRDIQAGDIIKINYWVNLP